MKCSACLTEVALEAMFCHKCGQRIAPESPPDSPQEKLLAAMGGETTPTPPAAPANGNGVEGEVLWQASYSPKAMVGYWLFAAVVTVLGLALPIFAAKMWAVWVYLLIVLLVWLWGGTQLVLLRLGQSYRLTAESFLHRRGILSQVTDRIEVIDMDDISFSQGLVERFLNVGTIKITSSDRTHPELKLQGIDDVERVATLLDRARREQRRRRGLHIESI